MCSFLNRFKPQGPLQCSNIMVFYFNTIYVMPVRLCIYWNHTELLRLFKTNYNNLSRCSEILSDILSVYSGSV